MNPVTEILKAVEAGDPRAAEELMPLVYQELRQLAQSRLASERPGQTLQATDLVHEAYRRLVANDDGGDAKWNNIGHFFGAAAEAMRRILIESARAKATLKRGGQHHRVDFEEWEHPAAKQPEQLLELDQALAKLETVHPERAKLVKLRFFAGLTNRQAAKALEISPATADRHWAYARAWLKTEMGDDGR